MASKKTSTSTVKEMDEILDELASLLYDAYQDTKDGDKVETEKKKCD